MGERSRYLGTVYIGVRTIWTMIVAFFWVVQACTSSYSIKKNGLTFAKIGENFPGKQIDLLSQLPATDTLFSGNGFSWGAKIYTFPEGRLIIEEDFEGMGTINRIRIESSEFHLKNTLRTGMSVSSLKSFADKWYVSYLSDYGLWDLSAEKFPSIHFLIENKLGSEAVLNEEVSLDHLPGASPIVSIVIM